MGDQEDNTDSKSTKQRAFCSRYILKGKISESLVEAVNFTQSKPQESLKTLGSGNDQIPTFQKVIPVLEVSALLLGYRPREYASVVAQLASPSSGHDP